MQDVELPLAAKGARDRHDERRRRVPVVAASAQRDAPPSARSGPASSSPPRRTGSPRGREPPAPAQARRSRVRCRHTPRAGRVRAAARSGRCGAAGGSSKESAGTCGPARRMPVVSETLDPRAARAAIANWYRANGRRLAFRESAEPWGVLVSEVMLQQTQVSRVEAAWIRFMAQFPTPSALAAATPADAIRAWSGLGYNRRALNLWRAATRIVERHGGQVPQRLEELLELPGIGAYTARAVAAISFGMPVAAVDTNVRRVVLRLYGETDPRLAQGLADGLVDPDAPDRWTHAVMDIGATLCRPRAPRCDRLPARVVVRVRFGAGRRRPRDRRRSARRAPPRVRGDHSLAARADRRPPARRAGRSMGADRRTDRLPRRERRSSAPSPRSSPKACSMRRRMDGVRLGVAAGRARSRHDEPDACCVDAPLPDRRPALDDEAAGPRRAGGALGRSGTPPADDRRADARSRCQGAAARRRRHPTDGRRRERGRCRGSRADDHRRAAARPASC